MTKLQRHYSLVSQLGCLICRNTGYGFTPAELHHPWGRKGENEFKVLPLCYSHHRAGVDNKVATSRHPFKRAFEARYGTEAELYEQTQRLITD